MLTRWSAPLLILALIQFSPSTMAAEPTNFAELKEQMLAAADEIKTWAADINTDMTGAGMDMKMTSSMQGVEDQFVASIDMQMLGQSVKMRSVVDDDSTMWIETDMGGFKQVMKMDMALVQQIGGANPATQLAGGFTPFNTNQHPLRGISDLENMYDMKLDAPVVVNRDEAYVVSGTMKSDAKEQLNQVPGGADAMGQIMNGVRMTIRKSDYFPLKIEMFGPGIESALKIDYENIQVNPEIDPSIFDYTPPPGTQVMDMTPILRQQLGAQNN